MKASKFKALIFLTGVLTYAWIMMLLSLMLVEIGIMRYVSNSTLRTILGIGTYVVFLGIWYFSVKRLINRELQELQKG